MKISDNLTISEPTLRCNRRGKILHDVYRGLMRTSSVRDGSAVACGIAGAGIDVEDFTLRANQ
jgi:hypothetical protein